MSSSVWSHRAAARRPRARLVVYLRAALIGLSLGSIAGGAHAQTHVGAARCQSCHPFEHQVWASGPHARAHLSLSETERADAKCNSCHTLAAVDAGNTKLQGVQCESCHGAGKYYQQSFVMKDKELARAVGLVEPTMQVCQRCHNEGAPSIKPFDFAAMWARIDHGRAAREAHEKKQAAVREAEAPKAGAKSAKGARAGK